MPDRSRTGKDAVHELAAALGEAADPRRAVQEKRYLRSDLDHLGVPVPRIRSIAKAFRHSHRHPSRNDVLGVVDALWLEPVHETRMLAVELLILYAPLLRPTDARRIEKMIRGSKTWALVDPLAATVVGDLLERYGELAITLDRWAADGDFWVRRAALLALMGPLRRGEGDFARFGRYADAMLEEKEFFIRKAIGWVLRETSKKRPKLVYDYLRPRRDRVSGLTLREGAKYLSDARRRSLGLEPWRDREGKPYR